MPKIAELREIEGALWARVEMDFSESQPISLLTGVELEAIKRQERRACWQAICDIIKKGPLPEPAHSERNGLVLATNIISALK